MLSIVDVDRRIRSRQWETLKGMFHNGNEEAINAINYTRAVYAVRGDDDYYRECLAGLWERHFKPRAEGHKPFRRA